jgi:hypothetical protein
MACFWFPTTDCNLDPDFCTAASCTAACTERQPSRARRQRLRASPCDWNEILPLAGLIANKLVKQKNLQTTPGRENTTPVFREILGKNPAINDRKKKT